jgi:hypothetical protein
MKMKMFQACLGSACLRGDGDEDATVVTVEAAAAEYAASPAKLLQPPPVSAPLPQLSPLPHLPPHHAPSSRGKIMTLAERIEVRKAAVRAEMEARVAQRLGPASAASATTSSESKPSHAIAGGSVIAPEGAVAGVAPLGADAVQLDFDKPSQDCADADADADAGEACGVEERPEEATQRFSVRSDDHEEYDLPLPEEEEDEAVVAKAQEVVDLGRAKQQRSFGKDTLDGYALSLKQRMRAVQCLKLAVVNCRATLSQL